MAKGPTYAQAQSAIMALLRAKGWSMSGPLKVPHATSPDDDFRLWFKAQAIYYSEGRSHTLGDARSFTYGADIRQQTPESFVASVERYIEEQKAERREARRHTGGGKRHKPAPGEPMSLQQANEEHAAGAAFFDKLDRFAKGEIGDALVLGEFDWREWLTKKPSAAFLNGIDSRRILWEMSNEG